MDLKIIKEATFSGRRDNWKSHSKNIKLKRSTLKATKSDILYLPNSYANAIEALEKDSKLISFATLSLSKVHQYNVSSEINMWKIND